MIKEDLLYYLKGKHVGEEGFVSSGELERLFCIDGKAVRKIITELRCEGNLGCIHEQQSVLCSATSAICSDANGFFYAKNRNEVNSTVQQLLGRTREINEAANGLVLSHQIFYDGLEW